MALTPYEPTTWVNDSEPDLDATNLNKVEQGIKDAIDGVNGILGALTNQLSTDPNKFAGISIVNTLNTALNNLSDTVTTLNSNLATKANQSDLNTTNTNFAKYNMEYHARINLTTGYISGMINDKITQGYKGGDIALISYAPPDTYSGNQYGIIKWTVIFSDIAYLQFLVPRSSAIITRAISVSESFDTGWTAH